MRRSAEEGDLEDVRKYVEGGKRSVYIRDQQELVAALGRGDAELVRALISPHTIGENIDDTNRPAPAEGLRIALERRDRELLGRLIRGGMLFNALDRDGSTPLVAAARMGWLAAVDDLIEAGADVDLVAMWGHRPLSIAVRLGHTDVAMRLLDAGAPIDRQHIVESTDLLYAAAGGGKLELLRFFASHPSMADVSAETLARALREALWRGHEDIVDELLPRARDKLSLAGICDLRILRKLLAAGVPPDRPNDDGDYPLLSSLQCDDRRRRAFHLLWERGADLNVRSAAGVTALMRIAHHTEVELMQQLMAAGADPDLADARGQTVLMRLCNNANSRASIQTLLDAGADPDLIDRKGRTALTRAALSGNAYAITMLLEAGADESPRDLEGRTAWEHFWWQRLSDRSVWTIPSPAGELQLALPRRFGWSDRTPLDERLTYTAGSGGSYPISFTISRVGRRVEIEPYDPAVVTTARLPVVDRETWRGLRIPVLSLGEHGGAYAVSLAVVPWGDDTLLLRLSGARSIAGKLRWQMRGVLSSLRPSIDLATARVEVPEITWRAVASDALSRRRIPLPHTVAVLVLLVALLIVRLSKAR